VSSGFLADVPDGAVAVNEERILLLTPTRRDAEVTTALLERMRLRVHRCGTVAEVAREVPGGVGAILMTDAALHDPGIEQLLRVLREQPSWSDVPSVLLCMRGAESPMAARVAHFLRNLTLLDRPTSARTLVSSVMAAIRARRRQYQMRRQFLELRHSESALRDSERQLHTMTENIPDALARLDRQLRFVFVNHAVEEFTGVAAAEFLGRRSGELGFAPDVVERLEDALHEAFSDGRQAVLELPIPGAAGVRHLETLLVPETGDGGRVETVLCVAHDVTARRTADAQMKAANRRKDEFLAMLAHELRNPLAPIRSAAEVLSRAQAPAPLKEAAVSIIERQSRHLTRLVDDLLDVSRITEGRIELLRVPVDMQAVVRQALESVEPAVRDKCHHVTLRLAEQPLFVEGDHARLVQCVSNLLTNAVKYTDAGGDIDIVLEADGAEVLLRVTDTGIGIPATLLPQLFDLFVQGERALDRSQGGLGIGLSVVRRLIDMHHGEVSACSEGRGRGSTFQIRLPRIAAPLSSVGEQAGNVTHSRRILVVDDNADAADLLVSLLSLDGHHAEAVYEPSGALARMKIMRPDVVLLDIGLPGMDGYELAARLRRQYPAVRLIALTGYGQNGDVERARQAGFDEHVIKPVDFARLNQLLASPH
jgi:PAS domain S-box-containing protein